MNKFKAFFFVIFLSIIFFPSIVNAECSEQEIQNLTKLANNIKSKYEHIENNEFKITFYNIPSDLYLNSNGIIFGSASDNASVSKEEFFGGSTYVFDVLSKMDSKCGFNNIKTIEIKLPIYNVFSQREECKKEENKELSVCLELTNKVITEEEFQSQIKKKPIYDDKNEKENQNIIKKILSVFLLPYVYIPLTIIVVTFIVVIIKKHKKRVF